MDCWRNAFRSYSIALEILNENEDYPYDYLEALQGVIRAYLALNDPSDLPTASRYQSKGSKLFNQLRQPLVQRLQKSQSDEQRQSDRMALQNFERQFSAFSQLEIDLLIAENNPTRALQQAEFYKNRRLTWILDHWQETITSPSYATLRQLLANPTHRTNELPSSPPERSNIAVVYWHLSADALTTFLLLPHHPDPILLDTDPATLRHRHQRFETWRKTWDTHYSDYRAKGKDITAEARKTHPWRTGLAAQLQQLRDLLGLPELERQYLQGTGQDTGQTIHQLILIPHRDLHRFPLHACFDSQYRCTYLPSLQIGLRLQAQAQPLPHDPALLCIKDPIVQDPGFNQPPLLYSALEAAILRALLPNGSPLDASDATQTAVTAALQTHQGLFHFTGHGTHNYRQPEQSALQLSDGLMDARSIAQLNLKPCRLASITACETALSGDQSLGQEYVGLTSAFLKAGAQNVLSTLWQVDEIASTWLVIRFYQILLEGHSPATALHQAQQWLRQITPTDLADWLNHTSQHPNLPDGAREYLQKEASRTIESAESASPTGSVPSHADPYFWAGFALTGWS